MQVKYILYEILYYLISENRFNFWEEYCSNVSYFGIFRDVLDEFLKELIVSGLTDSSQQKDVDKCNNLAVEQVKIVDCEGNLKLIYPSRADLNSLVEHSISILRN